MRFEETRCKQKPSLIFSDTMEDVKLEVSTKIEDNVSNILSYVGSANPGTSANEDTWAIKRCRFVDTKYYEEWANGEVTFANKWDDRASLSYS